MAKRDSALVALRQGIALEREGKAFYLEGEARTADPGGKRMFRALAQDELDHLNILKAQQSRLRKGQGWAPLKELPTSLPPIRLFPKGKKAASQLIPRKASDSDALKLAIDLEKRGLALYRQASRRATDPGAQGVYRFLVREEKRHLDLLTRALDYLNAVGPSVEFDDLERPFLEWL